MRSECERAPTFLRGCLAYFVPLKKVRGLLVESMKEYFEATRILSAGQTDKPAITEGAPLAAAVCVLSNELFPEAISLVRYRYRARRATCVSKNYSAPTVRRLALLINGRGA